MLDKTTISNYNRYVGYSTYGIVYNDNNVEKIIYPNTTLEYSVEARDYIGRATQIKMATNIFDVSYNTISEITTITNNVEYSDYFSNKIESESLNLYNSYLYFLQWREINESLNTTYGYDGINRLNEVTISNGDIQRKTKYSFVPAQNKTLPLLPKPGQSAVIVPQETISTIGTTNLVGSIEETGAGAKHLPCKARPCGAHVG